MKTVCLYNNCTGCMACISVCPRNAISIKDSLNAYNAIIDENKCINCDKCIRICQNNEHITINKQKPLYWYQGWYSDYESLINSSSGGIAYALSKRIIDDGGFVCSCTFKNGVFGFDIINDTDKIVKFSGSKYVKSNPIGVYKLIKDKLKLNLPVLFIGLPCQVAAVKSICGENIENLFTVDLICHGTPSPKLLEIFLNDYDQTLKNIDNIEFRKKHLYHVFIDKKGVTADNITDAYSYLFLNSYDFTENCYSCNYANIERISDITIGDAWGTKLFDNRKKEGKSVSLILCQTEKGNELLKKSNIELYNVDLDEAIKNNHQLIKPSLMPKKRKRFFDILLKDNSFNKAFSKTFPKIFFKQELKNMLIKLKMYK